MTNATSSGFSRETTTQNRNSNENVGVYIPPHRNGSTNEYRYSKQQLLDLYRNLQESTELKQGLSSLYVTGWDPDITNGMPTSPWARRDDQRDVQPGADVCWDRNGNVIPLSNQEFSAEEKEVRLLRFQEKSLIANFN